jgi:hypothetical protein
MEHSLSLEADSRSASQELKFITDDGLHLQIIKWGVAGN